VFVLLPTEVKAYGQGVVRGAVESESEGINGSVYPGLESEFSGLV